ncbi:MAG: radical SAM protein [Deltaproteobacteria bacterium]|nr:radical SAM protein [Deltaproteobacteria bacterium]
MLPVSDLLEVARADRSSAEIGARAPQRFGTGSGPVIVWNVCRHCNMSCPHCYAAAAYRPSKEDLTTDEARALIDDLAACGVRVVILSGGEPMLRPDLLELAAHANSLGIAPQLSTNGVYVDEAAAERLAAAGVRYVGISIDGVPGFNDEYRGMEGGYAAALRGLHCAKAAGMRTGLRMTLTRRNQDQVGQMLGVAEDALVDRFYVSHLLYSGRGRKMAGEDLSRAESRQALESLFTAAEEGLDRGSPTRVVTGSNDSDGPLLLRWIEARYGEPQAKPVLDLLRERGGNSAGEKILNIDHRGHVHPDQFWRAETLGDVRRDSFADILAHPMRERLRGRAEHLEGRCGACAYREICRGSHRERAIAVGAGLWGPDPACVMEDAEIGVGPEDAR